MKMGKRFCVELIVLFVHICTLQGSSNFRTAFHQDLYLTENDLRDATPSRPRRLSEFTASLLSSSSSSVDIVFSMTNRENVSDVIQFQSQGNKCTLLVTGPLDYREVASVFPGGSIPIPMKASRLSDPDDFALFNLVLNLRDSNDHAPNFVDDSLQAHIFPSQTLDDVNPIFRLRANDGDAVETGNGKVTYRLQQLVLQRSDGSTSAGDVGSWFRIDSETGNVDLLQPLVDDREMKLRVFASDSPLLSPEAPKTTTATAVLKSKAVDDSISLLREVNVKEGSTYLTNLPVFATTGNENLLRRCTVLNRNDLSQGISVHYEQGKVARLRLETSKPIDFETDGPSFNIDLLIESGEPMATVISQVYRIKVNVDNIEDEDPIFYLETLVNSVHRNDDLRDINPVLRVRALKREKSQKSLQYSIRSVAIKKRDQDRLDAFFNDGAIQIDASSGNVMLLKPINDLVNEQVEEIMVEVVVEDGSLVTKERAAIKLYP